MLASPCTASMQASLPLLDQGPRRYARAATAAASRQAAFAQCFHPTPWGYLKTGLITQAW